MITDEMVEAAFNAFWNHPNRNGHVAMRAALEAAERTRLRRMGKPGDASKSVMLKSLQQWMKEMRRETAVQEER